MRHFMGQQPAFRAVIVPRGEITRIAAIFRTAVMFKADAAQIIAEREQKFIPVEMFGAIKNERFVNQGLMRRNLFGLGL